MTLSVAQAHPGPRVVLLEEPAVARDEGRVVQFVVGVRVAELAPEEERRSDDKIRRENERVTGGGKPRVT